jgi:hypothetical protein
MLNFERITISCYKRFTIQISLLLIAGLCFLFSTSVLAVLQSQKIDLALQIIDDIGVLQDASTSSGIGKKTADHVNRHLKKSIDKLEKAADSLNREDEKKFRKENKKLRSEMDKVIALLTNGSHHIKFKKHKKTKKTKIVDPVAAEPLIAKAEAIQVSILQLTSDGNGNSELDRDGDGVNNDQDLFPDDPSERADFDSDGLGDNSDQCQNTPLGENVDSLGCSQTQLDADNDGVSNAVDQCPDTQGGESVDAFGCAVSELDSDNDTVNDDLDQCPHTTTGINVDSFGCPIVVLDDTDRDTIAGEIDNCPTIFNPDQADTDTDSIGDACEIVGAITITNPVASQVIKTSTTSVTGTFIGPAGSGVIVNGRQACVYNNQFVINNLPVNTGDHAIIAQLITAVGIGETTQITINRNGDSLYTLEPNTNCAVAPFDARFTLDRLDTSIIRIDIDYDDDGLVDASITDLTNPVFEYTYINPGTYLVSIVGFDNLGNPHNQSLGIIVQDGAAIDAVIQAGWQNITAGLSANNITQALNELTPSAQEKYAPVFSALQGNLPAILASFSNLQVVDINTDYAEYAINRTIDEVDRVFLVYFVKDENGAWKLDAM